MTDDSPFDIEFAATGPTTSKKVLASLSAPRKTTSTTTGVTTILCLGEKDAGGIIGLLKDAINKKYAGNRDELSHKILQKCISFPVECRTFQTGNSEIQKSKELRDLLTCYLTINDMIKLCKDSLIRVSGEKPTIEPIQVPFSTPITTVSSSVQITPSAASSPATTTFETAFDIIKEVKDILEGKKDPKNEQSTPRQRIQRAQKILSDTKNIQILTSNNHGATFLEKAKILLSTLRSIINFGFKNTATILAEQRSKISEVAEQMKPATPIPCPT